MGHQAKYEIDSHFINIGIGDGAVHVLLEKKNNKPQCIVRTVLIDGGLETAKETLAAAISDIRKKYHTQFRFDAIVITHWDEDHYGAVTEMLYLDAKATGESTYIDRNRTKVYLPWTGWNKIPPKGKFKLTEFGTCKLCVRVDSGQYVSLCEAVVSTNCLGYDLFTGLNIE
jgi:glyoxylase-like metal-dependent hydrolase (beta-lactamase superfamily II)